MRFKFLVMILCIAVNTAYGNDGFYQGSGSVLFPVHNNDLRVSKETLVITPIQAKKCYPVLYQGKPLRDQAFPADFKVNANEFAVISPIPENLVTCLADLDQHNTLVPLWQTEVTYDVRALRDQADVLIGFPIPTWAAVFFYVGGDWDEIPAPGVTNFKTFGSGKEITDVTMKWVKKEEAPLLQNNPGDGAQDLWGASFQSEDTYLAYTWRMSFQKGINYRLRTTYDFGGIYSAEFFAGREVVKGETPWFGGQYPGAIPAIHLLYYLTPLQLWAPPPPNISIKIALPPDIPVTYVAPMTPKPTCLDTHAIYYNFTKQFPTEELRLSYPNLAEWKQDYFRLKNNGRCVDERGKVEEKCLVWEQLWQNAQLRTINTAAEWQLWRQTLGRNQVQFTCNLVKQLLLEVTDPTVKEIIRNIKCVRTCEP